MRKGKGKKSKPSKPEKGLYILFADGPKREDGTIPEAARPVVVRATDPETAANKFPRRWCRLKVARGGSLQIGVYPVKLFFGGTSYTFENDVGRLERLFNR